MKEYLEIFKLDRSGSSFSEEFAVGWTLSVCSPETSYVPAEILFKDDYVCSDYNNGAKYIKFYYYIDEFDTPKQRQKEMDATIKDIISDLIKREDHPWVQGLPLLKIEIVKGRDEVGQTTHDFPLKEIYMTNESDLSKKVIDILEPNLAVQRVIIDLSGL